MMNWDRDQSHENIKEDGVESTSRVWQATLPAVLGLFGKLETGELM